jgi:hypothetical protein
MQPTTAFHLLAMNFNSTPLCCYLAGSHMKRSLLTKAKSRPSKRYKRTAVTREQLELALAWAHDEISYVQVQHALGIKTPGSNTYVLLARALRAYVRNKG